MDRPNAYGDGQRRADGDRYRSDDNADTDAGPIADDNTGSAADHRLRGRRL
jgi:hypothetical protein